DIAPLREHLPLKGGQLSVPRPTRTLCCHDCTAYPLRGQHLGLCEFGTRQSGSVQKVLVRGRSSCSHALPLIDVDALYPDSCFLEDKNSRCLPRKEKR